MNSVFRTPAEEQSAGRVVDYFYRVEFQERTPRFFFPPDSNYLFYLKMTTVVRLRFILQILCVRCVQRGTLIFIFILLFVLQ